METQMLLNQMLLFFLGQVITGAAIWGAIRADIRNMRANIKDVKDSTNQAHQRLDRMLERRAVERET